MDLSQEFPLSFSSHPGVSVVKLIKEREGFLHAIIGESSSEDVKVVYQDGYITTQIDGRTWYMRHDFGVAIRFWLSSATKFEIDEEGKVKFDGKAVAIGFN